MRKFLILFLFFACVCCSKTKETNKTSDIEDWSVWLTVTDSSYSTFYRVKVFNFPDSIEYTKYTSVLLDTIITTGKIIYPTDHKILEEIKIKVSRDEKDEIFKQLKKICNHIDLNVTKSKKVTRRDFDLNIGMNGNYFHWIINDTDRNQLPDDFLTLIDLLNTALKDKAEI